MATTPTFALPATFLGTACTDPASRFQVAGIPFDIGVTNRAGARQGPAAIRAASRMLVDGDNPATWRDPAQAGIADIGNFALALGDIAASLELIEAQAATCSHLIALGGDHTIALPLLRALRQKVGQPLALVHFDAHVDTWPDNFGAVIAHGSVFHHAITEGLVDPRHMVQIGIRSPVSRDIWQWGVDQGITVLTAEDVHMSNPQAVSDTIRRVVGDQPAYLSFDIDALDPAFAPGTGTPEVGGLHSWQAMAILKRLGGLDWRGMDVVEVLPACDVAEITALAAATVAWNYLSIVT
ncbi:agmatinase [Magnetospirillum sp. 64-120]|uniref:agmatinase n=1 Tax=Magnetospirillum sp. 64-120 TaxID=1895778 RepID=UPI00092C57AC|nr:agmatinase [Magnetospirillum sp. 64-120]OJX72178.1 MAG: agmatinase [Magnetospirillum sp. 64-120]